MKSNLTEATIVSELSTAAKQTANTGQDHAETDVFAVCACLVKTRPPLRLLGSLLVRLLVMLLMRFLLGLMVMSTLS